MLQQVWVEMDYQFYVFLVTKGRHIQLFRVTLKYFGDFLFMSVGYKLQYFQPFKCTDFMICVREL